MKKSKGLFVSFEGIDGSGKTTASKLVSKKLTNLEKPFFLTREPGGSTLQFAEDIRNIIMTHSDLDPVTELLLFESARKEHLIKKIIPNLEEGKIVVSDRFEDSTIAYQGYGKGIPIDLIKNANNIATNSLSPDIVFIFDLPHEVAIERIENASRETNRFDFEDISFFKKVRDGYLQLSQENERYFIIDATKTPEEISDIIVEEILKRY